MQTLKPWIISLAILALSSTLQAEPLGSTFTYQGKLAQNGIGVSGMCDFNFGLWDASAGGTEVAVAIDVGNASVEDGTFTVELDFGNGVFGGDARWLAIAVACPAGGGLTPLAPRQELTPSPHALYASEAGSMEWSGLLNVPADIADGDDVDDDDADPANELQDLSLGGNTLSLTGDAGPVDLSGYLDDTDDQTLAEVLGQGNDAGGTTIANLPAPTEDTQAATKAYVDAQAGGNQTLSEVLIQGNDAGGVTVTNLPVPIADSDATTKAYVDAQGGAQTLSDVLTQGNDAGGVTITNLPGPVAGSDAATRTYVDTHTDADADPTNELQDLSLGSNTLSLTGDASPVDLSGYLDDTDDQTLAEVLGQGNDAGGTSISNIGATTTNALTVAGLDCTGNTNGGALTTNASGVVQCSDDDAGAAAGNTLDAAYDQGGAGAGRTITADSGAVTIAGSGGLELDTGNLLQTPGNPVLAGSLPIGTTPRSVYVSGRYAYVVDVGSDDLKVIDVSDPSAPSLAGSLSIGTSPRSVYVSGRYAYVVDSGSDALKVIDVSDPSTPSLAGSLAIGLDPLSVYVSGRYAYVVDAGSIDLKVIDVSDPGAPSLAGSLAILGEPRSVFVSGRYAYVVDSGSDALKLIDVSDPSTPSLAGSLVVGALPDSVYVSGRYAYVVDQSSDGLKVIDVSDPSTPSLAGSLGIGDFPESVYVSGRYAYVVDETSNDLKVIDVSDPSTPSLAGSLGIGDFPESVYVSGRYAYVVDRGSDDLKVIDVSGAETTSLIAHSLEAGSLQVRNDIIAQGQLQVTGGINVGSGGLFSDGNVGVSGNVSAVGQENGVFGQTDATVGATIGGGFAASQVAGVYGNASVDTTTEVIHGVVGETRSTVGGGVYATNLSSDPSNAPDLVLGISDYGNGGDNGIISSEPSDADGDIFLHAMDTLVVRLNQDGTGDAQSLNSRFEITYTEPGPTTNRVFYVSHQGNVFADGSYNCGNSINDAAGDLNEGEIEPCLKDDTTADFAEMLPAKGSAQPGDVLVARPDGALQISDEAYADALVGVYSSRPSYLGNARHLGDDDHVPLAVSGIVPVKASAENGAIRAGDLLTSAARPGHAMRCVGLELCFGRVIGKALEPLPAGTGRIKILVSLN